MIASGDRLAVACAFAVALFARSAHAAPPPSDAEVATARALYRDAVVLERQNRLDEAVARLEAAYRTVKTPVLGLELGKIDVQLGRLAAAYDVLRAVGDIPAGAHETDKGREARRDAAALAAQIRDRLAMLKIALPADLVDAALRVDGAMIDDAESVIVDPGPHTVTITAGGRECASSSVTVQEGESRSVDLRERGAACVSASPRGVATAAARDADPPLHPLTKIPSPPPSETLSTPRWVALGLMGAGGLTAVIGGIVAIRAKSDYDSVASQCIGASCVPSAFNVREAARARATGATYAVGLGLVSAAAGVTIWIAESNSRNANAKRVGVALTTSGVSLTIVTQ